MSFELIHNGPVFPKEYKAVGLELGSQVLTPLAEEMLYHYTSKLKTDYVKLPQFNKNFYSDLVDNLTDNQKTISFPDGYQDLFNEIEKIIETRKAEKKAYDKEHKKEIEAEKLSLKEKYGYATLNGIKQPLGNFVVEGPGIFIGRGENNPSTGKWKRRVQPEDIIINSSNKINPPAGHKWKQEKCSESSMYTFCWMSNVGGQDFKQKEIRFGNNSDVKADADQEKFDKAENLLNNFDKMKKHIEKGLSAKSVKTRQCALASWIIMTTGIRVGNEIDESKRSVVKGCTTLTNQDVKIKNHKICLNFIGKDSIQFVGEYPMPSEVENLLQSRLSNKMIFDINSKDVADFLDKCIPGCTPKLFRTAIACGLWVGAVKRQNIDKSMKTTEKIKRVNNASVEVAKKLNHKKSVSKNLNSQLAKIDDQIQKCNDDVKKLEQDILNINLSIEKNSQVFTGKTLDSFNQKMVDKKKSLNEKISVLKDKIIDLNNKKDTKQQTADIAINTAKSNYCSPKIAYSVCKKYDIPISKIYSKTLIEKYKWAEDTDQDFIDTFPEI